MSKHTPGPWTVVERFGFAGSVKGGVVREYTNGTAQDQLFMVCCVQDDNGGHEATNANARLIAAAPDLLAALRVLLRDVEAVNAGGQYGLELYPAIYQAHAAIAKAEAA